MHTARSVATIGRQYGEGVLLGPWVNKFVMTSDDHQMSVAGARSPGLQVWCLEGGARWGEGNLSCDLSHDACEILTPPLPEQNFVGGRQQENIPPTCVDRTSFCSHQVPALVMRGRGLKWTGL